jgi:SAM-dependent methyltransferase
MQEPPARKQWRTEKHEESQQMSEQKPAAFAGLAGTPTASPPARTATAIANFIIFLRMSTPSGSREVGPTKPWRGSEKSTLIAISLHDVEVMAKGGSTIPAMSPSLPPSIELQNHFGMIDIYLFDQILRGRFDRRRRILDAGCGGGRNLVYFLRSGFEVFAVDREPAAVEAVRAMAAELVSGLPGESFRVASVESLPFEAESMDAVLSSAVLHFADDEAQLRRMVAEMGRVLRPGGLFFARLASSIGIEDRVEPIEGRRCLLPDGSVRLLVDEDLLLELTAGLGGRLLDPLKTTNVQNLRAMTTWCFEKGEGW